MFISLLMVITTLNVKSNTNTVSSFLVQILGVEMLSVLHRVLLTRDSLDIHVAAMRVVKQVVKAAQESLDGKKATVTK